MYPPILVLFGEQAAKTRAGFIKTNTMTSLQMTKSRRNLRDSRPASDDESEESDSRQIDRGRPVVPAS